MAWTSAVCPNWSLENGGQRSSNTLYLSEPVDLLRLGDGGVEDVLLERGLVRDAESVEVRHDDDGRLLQVDGRLRALGVLQVLQEALRRAHVLVVVPLLVVLRMGIGLSDI